LMVLETNNQDLVKDLIIFLLQVLEAVNFLDMKTMLEEIKWWITIYRKLKKNKSFTYQHLEIVEITAPLTEIIMITVCKKVETILREKI
jgi:hypothetical protein